MVYLSLVWILLAFRNQFYSVKRHTKILQIITLLLKQFSYFAFAVYAYIGLFKQPEISRLALGYYVLLIFGQLTIFKLVFFYILNKYRAVFGGNLRKVIVIGDNEKARQLIQIFTSRLEFGYKFEKQFKIKEGEDSLSDCLTYVIDNDINEIYSSVASLSNKQINKLISFADNNLREVKFIPDNKDIYSKKLKYEYYDYIPIISLRDIPLQASINKVI